MAPDRSSDRLIAKGIGDVSKFLLRDEVLVASVRRHVFSLFAALLETIGFIAIAAMLSYLFEYVELVRTISGLLFIAAVLRLAYIGLEWRLERFVITDRRVMLRSGVFNRNLATMPMIRVTDFTFDKPLIGQLLNYGTFIVESAGQDQALSTVSYLPHPDRLYEELMTILFGGPRLSGVLGSRQGAAPGAGGGGSGSPTGRRAPGGGLGSATGVPDFSDAPTGPISRVVVDDAVPLPDPPEAYPYLDGDIDPDDGTGRPVDDPYDDPYDGAYDDQQRQWPGDEPAPEGPVHHRPPPRWARDTYPPGNRGHAS